LNGGGGEIYRNFWSLPVRGVSLDRLVRTHFDSVDFSPCVASFSRRDYLERLCQKAAEALDVSGRELLRHEIELIYPFFRLRYWQSRNNALNNQLTYALTPFSESQFALQASQIPMDLKNHGRFEAGLISSVSKQLAKCKSAYGHNFLEAPPLKRRLLEKAVMYAPASCISAAKRVRAMRRGRYINNWPYYLSNKYLEPIFGAGELAVREWFDIERIKDGKVLSRALSVEKLLRGGL